MDGMDPIPQLAKAHTTMSLSMPARAVVTGWFFAGWSLLFDWIIGGSVEVNPALSQTPNYLRVILGLGLVVGCGLIMLSTYHWKNKSTRWRYEMSAYPVLISAWGLYTTSIFVVDGLTLFPLFLGTSFIVACAVRLKDILTVIIRSRKNVEQLPEELRSHE